MIIKRTYSLPPSESDPKRFISRMMTETTTINTGFILKIRDIKINQITISFTGNLIYEIESDVDCFIPKCSEEFDAVVQMSRNQAHLAIIKDRLKVMFHSETIYPNGEIVRVVLKEVKYQCGTYRAIADLKT